VTTPPSPRSDEILGEGCRSGSDSFVEEVSSDTEEVTKMARYMLLINTNPAKWAALSEAEGASLFQDYMTYTQELVDSGSFLAGDPLEGADKAKRVSAGGVVTDGPFADVTEVLGGYYMIQVPSIDEAVAWASKLPGVTRGVDRIEVREVREM
jgi:hypothetical protein